MNLDVNQSVNNQEVKIVSTDVIDNKLNQSATNLLVYEQNDIQLFGGVIEFDLLTERLLIGQECQILANAKAKRSVSLHTGLISGKLESDENLEAGDFDFQDVTVQHDTTLTNCSAKTVEVKFGYLTWENKTLQTVQTINSYKDIKLVNVKVEKQLISLFGSLSAQYCEFKDVIVNDTIELAHSIVHSQIESKIGKLCAASSQIHYGVARKLVELKDSTINNLTIILPEGERGCLGLQNSSVVDKLIITPYLHPMRNPALPLPDFVILKVVGFGKLPAEIVFQGISGKLVVDSSVTTEHCQVINGELKINI